MKLRALAALVPFVVLVPSCGGGAGAKPPAPPTPSLAATPPPLPEAPPRFEGLGAHRRKVTTTSEVAQAYVDQGLAFLSAFNHDEARRAFAYAAAVDPSCPMAHWGVAMSNAPHVNEPEIDAERQRAGFVAARRAKDVAARAGSPVERDLADAAVARFADPPPADRKPLDAAFAAAMRGVHARHPDDADVGAWFVESLLDLRPWDYWTPDGKLQPGMDEAERVLDATLARAPSHPLALHLQVHFVEASPYPERADGAADRLRGLAPGLGHLVHMPSHVDIRRGRWAEAIAANERAIASDASYKALSPKQGFYNLYMGHNRHMLAFAAMMRGQRQKATVAMRELVEGLDRAWLVEKAAFVEGFLAMPLEVMVRFGEWDAILAVPEPEPTFPLTRALRHYARGVAFAARESPKEARAELAQLEAGKAAIPKDGKFGNAPSLALATLAGRMLEGEVAIREGKTDDGLASLRAAVALEDALLFDEPPDWIQPVRHALGAALVRAGKAAEAEAVYRRDLARHPENGWSLFGLARALRLQKKAAEAKAVDARFRAAWADADVELSSSCFCLPGL